MLLDNRIHTFPCPNCGEIVSTGSASCEFCSAPIDAEAAEVAAARREQILKANGEANSLVLSARMLLLAFGVSFVPFISGLGIVAIPVLLVQVPWLAFRWHRRYGKLSYPEPELAEARRWWKESLIYWGLGLLATPAWIFVRFGGLWMSRGRGVG